MHQVTIHGKRVAYRTAGPDAPTMVLVHGITQDSSTWLEVADRLAEQVGIICIDLPGHGRSTNPAGDHSMGAYASTVRDLMFMLDRPAATVVGHSLGGGVALQFAYQFPEMTERLVLIDAGGLGAEVSPFLRAAALPLASPVIAGLSRVARRVGGTGDEDTAATGRTGIVQGLASLADRDARRAFLATVRATIGPAGQRVSATDKLYLAQAVPTLLIWGEEDTIIPVQHGHAAHERIPGSRMEIIGLAGHFPHVDAPDLVVDRILEFLDGTEPAAVTAAEWGAILRGEAPPG